MSEKPLPRWFVGGFLSVSAHLAALGGLAAFAWAEAQLTAGQGEGAGDEREVVVGTLVTLPMRTSLPIAVDAPAKQQESVEPPQRAAEIGGGGPGGYFARLRAHLATYRSSPLRPDAGVAQVRFRIGADGSVGEILLAGSSGDAALDDEAIALVLRASPVPPPPRAMTVMVPVEFR